MKKRKILKSIVSFCLAFVFAFGAASGAFPTSPKVNAANVYCNVGFSMPAICCDVGDVIDLTKCAVQFSPSAQMTKSGISWTYDGKSVTSFTAPQKGVYTLVAKSGNTTKNIYVVAKLASETEYVLYKNDFSTAPTDFRVIEASNGGSAYHSGGNYVVDGSGNGDAYVKALLPSFLDSFGDVKIRAILKVTSAVDDTKWGSIMYRLQNGNYPYYQTCFRYNHWLSNGVEVSQRNASNGWTVYRTVGFRHWDNNEYAMCEIDANGTESVLTINGIECTRYANTEFAAGAIGFQTRGAKLLVDDIEIVLKGNKKDYSSCDVSFSKPAIRADMGDTIDLSACDVQFNVDSLYTSGKNITWKKDGNVITTFTPASAGVTKLTATSGNATKNVYVVTRNLYDGEYVIYFNDFSAAPTDFRVVQQTDATAYHDGNGNYVIDASKHTDAYGRVLLPTFLDDFGDMKIESSYRDINPNNERNWSSLMGRVQNGNFPYMQMCIRYNTTLPDGVEIAERTPNDNWSVKTATSFGGKNRDNNNVYSLVMQNNNAYAYIHNGDYNYLSMNKVISYDKNLYVTGAMGFQAKGLKIIIDWVRVTLGETTAEEDTSVKCTVSRARPAIGCNVGQTVLLSECDVQFVYGSRAVDSKYVTWKKDGKVITEFSATTHGNHLVTATHGDMTINVYIVAKGTSQSEYEIYLNGFDTAPTDFRVIEASHGGSAYHSNGNYVLKGSGSGDSHVRVLLPSFLDDFGEAKFEVSAILSAPVDNAKWAALMYRVQNGNFPYMQGCLRYNATAENGIEISQRTPSNEWSVKQHASTTHHVPEKHNLWSIEVSGQNSFYSINNNVVLIESNTPFSSGAWGLQVRGLTLTLDWVRVFFTSNNTNNSIYIVPGEYLDVRDPQTGIQIAPALITEVKTMEEFKNIATNTPAIAIMTYDVVDGKGKIVFSDGTASPDEALNALGGKIIPAFRINDNADADSLSVFLKSRYLKDSYAVSTNPSALKRAYQNWKYIRGVVDYSARSGFIAEDLRYEAMANSARVVILGENTAKSTVTAFQDSYSMVWLVASEGKTASVNAINKGPHGIITPNRALTEQCYSTYYANNTLVRRVNVIGHRGNPSVAQENTVDGAKTAYSNGAGMVENDIYLVKDGVLMVMHDGTIDRTTNGSGSVTSFTSGQLKQFVVDSKGGIPAQPVPSLEDYFREIKGKPGQKLVIEIKDSNGALPQALADIINRYGIMDQVVVISFMPESLAALRRILPGVGVGYLNGFPHDELNPNRSVMDLFEHLQTYNCVTNPGYSGWGTEMVKAITYRGVNIWPWTINNQQQFEHLMFSGCGGITTDYSQWSKDFISEIYVNSAGRVISKTYGGATSDISSSVEFVVVEDNLGISYSNGVVNVPQKKEGGKASYFFRYKARSPLGREYYMVSEVKTVEVEAQNVFELVKNSPLKLNSDLLFNVTPALTVSDINTHFRSPVGILDSKGNELPSTATTATGYTVYLKADKSKTATIVIKGDVDGSGVVDSTDYMKIKSVFLGKMNLLGVYYFAADCDDSGVIDSTDYIRMKSYFLGKYELFPEITHIPPADDEPSEGTPGVRENYAKYKSYTLSGKLSYNGGLSDNGVILTDGVIPNAETAGQTVAFSGTNAVNTVVIDLAGVYTNINEIVVGGVRVNGNRQYGNVVIETSRDNNSYSTVSDYTVSDTLTNETGTYNYSYKLSGNVTARYVKITFTSASYVLTLGEIEVYGN